jgi:hypothetical protein
MFRTPVGVVQSSCQGPLLGGGMFVKGGRDAAGAGIIPEGDRHVEEKGGDALSHADSNQDGQPTYALHESLGGCS